MLFITNSILLYEYDIFLNPFTDWWMFRYLLKMGEMYNMSIKTQ